jgi:hypothetical protein
MISSLTGLRKISQTDLIVEYTFHQSLLTMIFPLLCPFSLFIAFFVSGIDKRLGFLFVMISVLIFVLYSFSFRHIWLAQYKGWRVQQTVLERKSFLDIKYKIIVDKSNHKGPFRGSSSLDVSNLKKD